MGDGLLVVPPFRSHSPVDVDFWKDVTNHLEVAGFGDTPQVGEAANRQLFAVHASRFIGFAMAGQAFYETVSSSAVQTSIRFVDDLFNSRSLPASLSGRWSELLVELDDEVHGIFAR